MNPATALKITAAIQASCALGLVAITLYCNKKQREFDARLAEGYKKLADGERYLTTLNGQIVPQ